MSKTAIQISFQARVFRRLDPGMMTSFPLETTVARKPSQASLIVHPLIILCTIHGREAMLSPFPNRVDSQPSPPPWRMKAHVDHLTPYFLATRIPSPLTLLVFIFVRPPFALKNPPYRFGRYLEFLGKNGCAVRIRVLRVDSPDSLESRRRKTFSGQPASISKFLPQSFLLQLPSFLFWQSFRKTPFWLLSLIIFCTNFFSGQWFQV